MKFHEYVKMREDTTPSNPQDPVAWTRALGRTDPAGAKWITNRSQALKSMIKMPGNDGDLLRYDVARKEYMYSRQNQQRNPQRQQNMQQGMQGTTGMTPTI